MTNDRQTSLFDIYPDHPGYRRTDTSRDAAEAIAPQAPTLRQMCLKALAIRPMSADEVADHLGISCLAIRPRITELRKMGKIVDSGVRRKNSSGKNAVVWRLADGELGLSQ